MRRASETIGAIAAALAKAQGELANPEKELVATIHATHPRESDRTFRYASLSTGLDIVRKALGKQEIAIIQTTAIDAEARWVRLTTVLAHSSGEWLSSEWPVCSVSEIAAPKRMGAALTYARRYALFTLVGIAGEDDLDAPDLNGTANGAGRNRGISHGEGRSNCYDAGRQAAMPQGTRQNVQNARAAPSILPPEHSEELCARLCAEVSELNSADDAANWAHRALPTKNTLTSSDAAKLETRFQARLNSLGGVGPSDGSRGVSDGSSPQDQKDHGSNGEGQSGTATLKSRQSQSRPSLPAKVIRLRDRDHRKFVSQQPCLVCGRKPAEAHHLRFAQPRALGRKVSDEFTVPVCRLHHREIHRHGDEAAWWNGNNVNPLPTALMLWQQSRVGSDAHVLST